MKSKVLIGLLAVVLLIVPSSVYPWGSAVHAYIASQLKPDNYNVYYGTLAPDMFNYAFEVAPLNDIMYAQFHTNPELLWNPAGTAVEKSLAWGFMNHKWDDETAHFGGIQFGKNEGYVIAKAKVLDSILADKFPEYAYIKSLSPELALSVAHNIVENSIDILLKRVDPTVGDKLLAAATYRDAIFPTMVVNVWGGLDPALPVVIPAVESAFKGIMLFYGQAFKYLEEPDLIDALSEQMAALANAFLPEGFPPLDPDVAFQIVKVGTIKGMDICKGTFLKEIKLTIDYAGQQLSGYSLD